VVVDAIIFDVDGTLALFPIDWDFVVAAIRKEFCTANSFLGFVNKCFGTDSFWRIHKILTEIELKSIEKLIVFDSSPKIVSSLCKFHSIGFVTMQSRDACFQALKKLGVDWCTKAVVTREDARNRFEQIAKAVKILGVKPQKALFIGDKILDVFAAYVNGLKAILVARNVKSFKISDTDDIEEDLEVLEIPIAHSLSEAVEVASRLGWVVKPGFDKGF